MTKRWIVFCAALAALAAAGCSSDERVVRRETRVEQYAPAPTPPPVTIRRERTIIEAD